MTSESELIEQVRKNGYFVLPSFFDRARIADTRSRLAALLDEDILHRKSNSISVADYVRQGHSYSLTDQMHTMLFPSFSCPEAAQLIEDILNDRNIAGMLKKVVGENFRLRVDLARRATGINDTVDSFQLPHEWHRDTPGEFTFGIFLDDMTQPYSGGTAVISRGTHLQPFDPIWDFMLGPSSYTNKKNYLANRAVRVDGGCRKITLFNKLAKRDMLESVVELRGAAGDIYMFLNDVWHGRAPNRQSKDFMTMRFGGFPTDFPFKDDLPLPRDAGCLPATLRRRYSVEQPVNNAADTVVHQCRKGRPKMLFRLAHWEKQLAVRCTERKAEIAERAVKGAQS